MKTLIIGLFSLALLASGAAWSAQHRPSQKPPPGPLPQPGVQAICNWSGGIIVIVLTQTGDITAVACNAVGGKPIRYKSIDPGMKLAVQGDLGKVRKHKIPGEADPCVTWVISGTSYSYCW
jgi:hypothetical protein